MTTPRAWRVWTDNAVRFAPYEPSAEEDAKLIALAIAQTPPETTVNIAKQLLARAVSEPDRLFVPTVWVEAELGGAGGQHGT